MHLSTALTLRRLDSSAYGPTTRARPGYDPADLLKLYIYGYLNRIRSSRRLEVETHRNLEAIWLLRQLRPDFKTIADFRRDNRNAFREVFRQFVRLCRELDLYGRELIAVDGTRIKAVNHRGRNFTRARLKTDLQRIDDRLDRYLDQMNEADADDAGGRADTVTDLQEKIASIRKRKETLEGHRQALDDSGEAQRSLTDPDSRSMHPGTRVGVGYNVQIAVDTKHNLIAEQQVHSKVSDLGLLAQTATAARENLAVDEIDVVADRGYYKIEDIEDCEAAWIHAIRSEARPEPGQTQWPLYEVRIQVRRHNRRLRLSGWPASGALVSALRQQDAKGDVAYQLRQSGGLPIPAIFATDAPKPPTDGSSATRTRRRWTGWRNASLPGPR